MKHEDQVANDEALRRQYTFNMPRRTPIRRQVHAAIITKGSNWEMRFMKKPHRTRSQPKKVHQCSDRAKGKGSKIDKALTVKALYTNYTQVRFDKFQDTSFVSRKNTEGLLQKDHKNHLQRDRKCTFWWDCKEAWTVWFANSSSGTHWQRPGVTKRKPGKPA